jgi:hypothetical protein
MTTGPNSADELFARYPGNLNRALDQTVAAVAEDIARERIYHWDSATLRIYLEDRAKAFRQDVDRIFERYLTIIVSAEEREALRAGGGNHPSIIGGGFGVEGAARGIAIATAANAAISVFDGAANAMAKAAAKVGDRQKKTELLKAPETREVLADLIRDIALEGHRLVADVVNGESAVPKFDVMSSDARQRASALIENVEAGRVPETEIGRVLMEAMQLNPFYEKPWCLWLEHLGDRDGGVGLAAETFGVAAVASHKDDLLARTRATLAWSTPEECRSNLALLYERARFLGLPFEEERRQIEDRAEALDRERRTFMGTVYDTMEEANEARLAAEDLAERTIDGVVYASQEEADAEFAIKSE